MVNLRRKENKMIRNFKSMFKLYPQLLVSLLFLVSDACKQQKVTVTRLRKNKRWLPELTGKLDVVQF
jgi:hypothetical protein